MNLSDEQLLSLAEVLFTAEELFVFSLSDNVSPEMDDDERMIACVKANYSADDLWSNYMDEYAVMLATDALFDETVDYIVLTASVREERLSDYAQSYFNDCVEDQIPSHLRPYVDVDRWIEDFICDLDAGNTIAVEDGIEHEIYTNKNELLYIYKIS